MNYTEYSCLEYSRPAKDSAPEILDSLAHRLRNFRAMKLEIHVQDIRQTVECESAAEALSLLKKEAASRAPFLLRGVIKSLGDLQFAGEVVKRANAGEGRSDPLPKSAQEFLDWAVSRGYATVLEA